MRLRKPESKVFFALFSDIVISRSDVIILSYEGEKENAHAKKMYHC